MPAMNELYSRGAKPADLAAVAGAEPMRMIEAAGFLASVSRLDEAMTVLAQAEAGGVPIAELLLMRAKLQLRRRELPAAQATVAQAHSAGVRDVRLALLDAQLQIETSGAQGASKALEILDGAAAQYPLDLDVHRMRVDLLTRFEKWNAMERALEGFKQALYHHRGGAGEAHAASARISRRLSRWSRAIDEYRIALGGDPTNVSLWIEFGQTAHAAGRITTAREAYAQAARLNPNDPALTNALRALDEEGRRARESALTGSSPPGNSTARDVP
jgi:tetratricopeptide (TPR) repeat protein